MFVGGIPWEATDQDLVACFSPFGELVSASIVKDKMTGRSRGFGFVTFALPEVLDAVFAPDKEKTHEIRGRVVDVRRAVPRGQEGSINDRKRFRDALQNDGGAPGGAAAGEDGEARSQKATPRGRRAAAADEEVELRGPRGPLFGRGRAAGVRDARVPVLSAREKGRPHLLLRRERGPDRLLLRQRG